MPFDHSLPIPYSKLWNQPKSLLADKWIKKISYIPTEYYLPFKKKDALSFATTGWSWRK
jgi:hypothetical protein